MKFDFKNKVVIVSGGTSGIGKSICELFISLGARVYSSYYHSRTDNKKNLFYQKVSLNDFSGIEKFIKGVFKKEKRIDIIVNNAGFAVNGRVDRLTENDWDEVLEGNLKGTFAFIRAVSKYMIDQQSGKIINIASINGMRGREGTLSYNVSKAGIISLTKTIANELGMYNINVNVISPGFVYTEKQEKTPEIIKKLVIQESALKKFCYPNSVAHLVAFLASEYSTGITGENIKIDCGQYI